MDDLFSAISAANVSVGNSWLAERVGERVGSDLVTIVDDGTLPGRLGSSPFDGEGVATRTTTVFDRGVLRTFLYDTYYARKLGAQTTGNSTGGGIGANNFYLQPGTQSLEELIASTPRGVLVLDTIGFATEHASGTYSRGARGFLIENGELSYPIDEFTIAGSFPAMLAAIDAVANDLRFDGSVVSPSFRVARNDDQRKLAHKEACMPQVAISFTLIMRIEMPNETGAFGVLANAIGDAGGQIAAVDMRSVIATHESCAT